MWTALHQDLFRSAWLTVCVYVSMRETLCITEDGKLRPHGNKCLSVKEILCKNVSVGVYGEISVSWSGGPTARQTSTTLQLTRQKQSTTGCFQNLRNCSHVINDCDSLLIILMVIALIFSLASSVRGVVLILLANTITPPPEASRLMTH